MSKKISFFSLVVLIIGAIDNMRNLPAVALFGAPLIFFFFLSALLFLIPTALVAAELSAAFPDKGGVYQWVNRAFGKKCAMIAIWLQWINTMVWFPTMLSFIAGTLAYLISPELAQNKWYLISCILGVFWGLTWINLKGIYVSARLNNLFSLVGTIVPLIFLVILGCFWFFSGKASQITITPTSMIPSFAGTTNWVALVAIMASFLGIELSGVHVGDIKNPQRNFPRAVLLSAIFILLSMSLGSLSIAMVLPEKDIDLVSGIMQVFSRFFEGFGLQGLTPVLTLLIVVGSVGTMINWLISPAKGLLHAAEFGFLPAVFTKKNKAGVAAPILIAQGVLVSLFSLVFLLVPSVNAFYWFLTALSTELYMIMYILMFASAIKLHYTHSDRSKSFKIPGKTVGMWLTSFIGLSGCLITILVSFFPPEYIYIGSKSRYLCTIIAGNLLTISPVFLFFFYKKKQQGLLNKG